MTTYPHRRTDRTGPIAAMLIALSMALAILSVESVRGPAPEARPMPTVTPAPGIP